MKRYSLIEYDETAEPKVIAVYDQILAELGFGIVPNLFKSMAVRPGFLEAQWTQFRTTILQGELPRTLKEMIGVAVSQSNHSEYALRVHLHSLSALGLSEEVLRLLVEDFDACPLPQRQKESIRFGLKAAVSPRSLGEHDYQALHQMGLMSSEIFEIVVTANLFTAVNQYTDTIDLEIDAL